MACLEKLAPRGEMVSKEIQVCLVLMAHRAKMDLQAFQGHPGLKENQDSPEFLVEVYPDQKDVTGDQVKFVPDDDGCIWNTAYNVNSIDSFRCFR